MTTLTGCTLDCWTPVRCRHGREMTPIGRSVPLEMPVLCDCYQSDSLNVRHLWSEHDSNRVYNDPEGWASHESACGQCKGDPE